MNDPRMIIGIDPGDTTGLAVWVSATDNWRMYQVGPCKDDEQLKKVLVTLSDVVTHVEPFGPGSEGCIHIVLEPFQFRKDDSYRDKIDYIAAEVIGAIRVWAYERSFVRLIMQGASYGVEGFWSDEKVKKIGLWLRGKRHAMDATEHVLMYRTFKLNDQSLLMLLR